MALPNGHTNKHTRPPTVYVVDDDHEFCKWTKHILASVNIQAECFQRPSEFLDAFSTEWFGCILLDVRLPEISGIKLFKQLKEQGVYMPVLIITAYGEVAGAVEALKTGAVDYIQKPISAQALIDRIQRALSVAQQRVEASDQISLIRDRMAALSPRETQVLELLLEGKNTKQISASLGVGLTTIDFHRKNVLEKMQVENVVELAHLVDHYKHLNESIERK